MSTILMKKSRVAARERYPVSLAQPGRLWRCGPHSESPLSLSSFLSAWPPGRTRLALA